MATIQPIDRALSEYTRLTPNRQQRQLIQWSLDFRRALIFRKRVVPEGYKDPKIKEHLTIQESKSQDVSTYTPVNTPSFANAAEFSGVDSYGGVSIVLKDAWGNYPALHHINLPFIPKEVNYNSESSFASIKPIGRNGARYHYTGSEDKIEFEIDWYSFETGRQDVITNCRLIESLSKSDGYAKPPPKVLLYWGDSNHLFMDMEFIVIASPYRLTQFNRSQIINNNLQHTHLMPIQAYQKVTLARVSSNNLSTKDIQYVSKY